MMKTDGVRIHARKGSSLQEKLEFRSMPEPNSGCLLWLGPVNTGGYPNVVWRDGKTERGNRVVWEMNHGPIPDGLHVLHKCDVRSCVNIAHLFLGTNDDNVADMMAKGRNVCARGEQHAMSKLNDDIVRAIRAEPRTRCHGPRLAARFGVTQQLIYQVLHRQVWAHVK